MELNNSFTVHKHIYLKSTLSTNDYAFNALSNSNPKLNYSIYTFNQTQGKGQIGRYWYCGEGNNLAMTIVVNHLNLKVKDQFLLNIACSLGVTNYLMRLFNDAVVKIKWPNDIYIDNKKIAGILIQNQLKGSDISKSIIGIGLNVNEKTFSSDLPNPISMFNINQDEYSLLEVKQNMQKEVLSFLSKMLLAKKLQKKLYKEHLYRKGEKHFFEIDKKHIEANLVDVDEDGKLILQIGDEKKSYNFRELKFII